MRDFLQKTTALFFAIVFAATVSPALGQEKSAAVALGDTGIPSADPSVILTNDGYVTVESRRGHALLVRVAPSLEALSEARAVRIWFDRDHLGEVWAPEIVFGDGQYSVYFAAGVGSAHRMYRISSSRPNADFSAASEIALPGDKWAIDGLPFTYGNSDYFAWSGWQGDTDVQQDIFIVRLGEDGEPQGASARIASPDQPWENVAGETPSINEGPQPIVDLGGQLHIVYSANGSWGPNYCLADLRLRSGGDPIDADAWDKSDGCLFGANQGTLADGATLTTRAKGVGHHSFVLADGDAEKGPAAGGSALFLYHGVPADMEPSNFWAARKWFIGSYQWIPDVTYGSGDDAATGWSLRFLE